VAEALRPLPPVGARIKLEYLDQPKSPTNWLRAGLVIAVAEGEAMLVKRWLPKKARHVYLAISIWEWQWDAYQEVLTGRVRATAAPKVQEGLVDALAEMVSEAQVRVHDLEEALSKSRPRWVPLGECGALTDGKYTVRNAVCAFIGHWHNGWWSVDDMDPVEVTHVLSPELGPIPEDVERVEVDTRRWHKFDMRGADDAGEKRHPQVAIRELYPDTAKFVPESLFDCWLFLATPRDDAPSFVRVFPENWKAPPECDDA
jgi:hypothetical protein